MGCKDIAIVGIYVASPAGDGVKAFWDGISTGGDFITDIPASLIEPGYFEGGPGRADRLYCRRGGICDQVQIDPLRYGIMPITAAGTDPEQLFALYAVEQALADAGVFEKKIPLQNCSVIIGKGNYSNKIQLRSIEIMRNARQFAALLKEALPDLTDGDLEAIQKAYQSKQGVYNSDMATGMIPNITASLVANRFDMHGPAYLIDAACASGIVAVDHSISILRSGQCDISVAGGMHFGNSAMFQSVFELIGALSQKQIIAPFSESADGLLVGQGAGFIVLKLLDKARDEGDRIYAVIKETAVSSDGSSSHIMVTSVDGQIRTLKRAWDMAGMDPDKIGYVEAHGTGTVAGDRTEIMTLKSFFGDSARQPAYVGSVKSNIGHTMPAAGIIGVIKAALSLYMRRIPPTLHCETPQKALAESRFTPPQEPVDWDADKLPLVAGVNAFGFGGINAHAILTAHEPEAVGKLSGTQARGTLSAAQAGGSLLEPKLNGGRGSIAQRTENSMAQRTENTIALRIEAPPILTDFPELREIAAERRKQAGHTNGWQTGDDMPEPPPKEYASPIGRAIDINIREAIAAQRELGNIMERHELGGSKVQREPGGTVERHELGSSKVLREPGVTVERREHGGILDQRLPALYTKFLETLHLCYEDHPYLIDHAIVRQPEGWPDLEDHFLVVPFTMAIELLADIAKKRAPGKKLIKMGNITMLKWISVETPVSLEVKGDWIKENVLEIKLGDFAGGECTFGDGWPELPEEYSVAPDIGDEIIKGRTPDDLYEKFSFHGPQYQSLTGGVKICERGMAGSSKRQAGKGSLLDLMGQLLGLFLHLTQAKNQISFPVRLGELLFSWDISDQAGDFYTVSKIKRLTDNTAISDTVFTREGRVWCVARDFMAQRFVSPPNAWNVILDPRKEKHSAELEHGVFLFAPDFYDSLMYMYSVRYLGGEERVAYSKFKTSRQRREYLIGRVALKDAVRARLAEAYGQSLYPIEITVGIGEDGRVFAAGRGDRAGLVDNLAPSLSFSYKENVSAAIISDKPAGIGLEIIGEKPADSPETVARLRLQAAKEAYAKLAGDGVRLQVDPSQFRIRGAENDILLINDTRIKTIIYENKYIIGWTL